MYFRIEKSGCSERKGLVQIRYDLCLDEQDYGYTENCNPFCSHFCQFEPNVTDEEILFVGELALDMAYKNWGIGNLHLNKNLPVNFSLDSKKKADCELRLEKVKTIEFHKIKTDGKYKVRA